MPENFTPANFTAETAFVMSWGYVQQSVYRIAYGTDENFQPVPYEAGSPGPNHDLWWVFYPHPRELMIAVQTETIGTDPPNPAIITAFQGTPDALTLIRTFEWGRPFQLPTTYGTPIYLRYQDTTPTAGEVKVTIETPPAGVVPDGSFIITDDDSRFPAAVIGPDGTIIGYIDVPAGEGGAILSDNTSLVHNVNDGTLDLFSYGSNGPTLLLQIPTLNSASSGPWAGHPPITSNRVDTFYAADGNATMSTRVYRVSKDGVVTGQWSLPYPYAIGTLGSTTGVVGLGASPDGTILYIIGIGTNHPIRRWDLVNNVGLSDIVAGVAGTSFNQDLLVLADGSFIVSYQPAFPAVDYAVHYSSAGAVLNTYALPAPTDGNIEHMTQWLDDTAFVVWWQSNDVGTVQIVRVSDGVVTNEASFPIFDVGEANSFTPGQNFGVSSSCTIISIPHGFTIAAPIVSGISSPLDCCDHGTGPPKPPNPTLPPPVVQYTAECDEGGIVPDGNAPVNSEDWTLAYA